jgi:hypothetical protein
MLKTKLQLGNSLFISLILLKLFCLNKVAYSYFHVPTTGANVTW